MRTQTRNSSQSCRLAPWAGLLGVGLIITGCSHDRGWTTSDHRADRSAVADAARSRRPGTEAAGKTNPARTRASTVETYHQQAVQADREGRYAEAETDYKRALAGKPTDANIWNDLGYSYLLQGRIQEAELALGRAVALSPNDRRARNNLGIVLAQQGRTEEAMKEFRTAGTEAEAQRNLALAMRQRSPVGTNSVALQPPIQSDPRNPIAQAALDAPLPNQSAPAGIASPQGGPAFPQNRAERTRWVPYEEPQQPYGVSPVMNQPATGATNPSSPLIHSAPSVGGHVGRRTLSTTQMGNAAVESIQGASPLIPPPAKY